MLGLLRRREKMACRRCGAMVGAAKLEESDRKRRDDDIFGMGDFEFTDSAIIWKGWPINPFAHYDHDVACGVCGTTRRSY
jgi:hypothetical protein